ncbi:MAG: helix-turn-helix domain-containing protein [Candidatus Ornithomonoglobus sp.]
MTKFSKRLRELRQSKDLTQQKFADYIGISKSSVNMYERGEREPGLETIEMIADFFNVDLDYLLGKSNIPNRSLQGVKTETDNKILLSEKEKTVINAYRSQPEMQPAVDRLLGITDHFEEKRTDPTNIGADISETVSKAAEAFSQVTRQK